MNNYPTKTEILEAIKHTDVSRYTHNLETWKAEEYNAKWSQLSNKEKQIALFLLCHSVSTKPILVIYGDHYGYTPHLNQVTLDIKKPSIMSTLHELGHHEFGIKEIDACRFSVKLFTQVFPSEYSKLIWCGHMLKLPAK